MRALAIAIVLWPLAAEAQQTAAGPAFEVVSLKRSDPNARGGGIRLRPDGQMTMTNQGLSSIIRTVAPSVADIIGMPDWMNQDRYDLVATPPPNTPRAELVSMWKAMWADRMKLVSHIESRERPAFSLVLARSDGRLGPNMRPATIDCGAPRAEAAAGERCGLSLGPGIMESGSATIGDLTLPLRGLSGRPVILDKTGLTGRFAVRLTYSERPDQPGAPPDERPTIFTALQEQLGLKLEPTQTNVDVLVIDHIERPTEN